jgi:hypothetical protein
MFIRPSREQYKPEDDLKVSGSFLAVCSDVQQGIPWDEYPGKTRIAIQFTISDGRHPRLKGKKTAIVCGESVYKPKSGGKPSHLYTYAQMMGVVAPERGFDPEQFLDKWYMITTELYNGKAMVRSAIPVASPVSSQAVPTASPVTEEMIADVAAEEKPPF